MDADQPRLSWSERPLRPAFERRQLILAPGQSCAYAEAAWRGALVVVAGGQLQLEGLDGSSQRFGRGAILALERLRLRALHNDGAEPLMLVAITRRSAGVQQP